MPELPDLEVFRGNLTKHLLNRALLAIGIGNPKNVSPASGPLLDQLIGQPLTGIERNGKELFFCFPGQKSFAVHLMLKGKFHLCDGREQAAAVGYRIATFDFDGRILVINDPGRLCKVQFMPRVTAVPDALSPEFSLDYLAERLRGNLALNIKAFLIDQKMVKGIGNAYADEILWESRIAPQSLCENLPPAVVAQLHASIRGVLTEAIASIRNEAPEIIGGEIRSFLKVHNPRRQTSPTGKPIQVRQISSKTTYFTDEQVLY